jgi:hypothetical protein
VALTLEQISPIDSCSHDIDDDLVGTRPRLRDMAELEDTGASRLIARYGQHGREHSPPSHIDPKKARDGPGTHR